MWIDVNVLDGIQCNECLIELCVMEGVRGCSPRI